MKCPKCGSQNLMIMDPILDMPIDCSAWWYCLDCGHEWEAKESEA